MAWPSKTVPDFTDDELATAIEQHEHSADPVNRQIAQGCIREWESRRGITSDSD
ncbi:hypothetical protein QQY24_32010 [Streptomyces sp. TG1A-8]|uniref:hypothetical protein n=1 Tax=Streptomyces sp. TG1A-8 TaxID=3051385 RepID=UPI00265BD1B9|nr:hypothetical protein [Streptomyces sp. TG1A-8]MDO0929728.1 hypothetical protein [Streptomyces sp. TG1A-8]MDO0929751.1 hypothetical protein [Streptomyces sp. TG1A-8]